MMVNGIMVEISSNVGHKEYICVGVCVCSNFVVIIWEYTTGAGQTPSVCHCIDGCNRGTGKGRGRGWQGLFFLAATA